MTQEGRQAKLSKGRHKISFVNDAAYRDIENALQLRSKSSDGFALPSDYVHWIQRAADDVVADFKVEHTGDAEYIEQYAKEARHVADVLTASVEHHGTAGSVVRVRGGESLKHLKAIARHEMSHVYGYSHPLSPEGRYDLTQKLTNPNNPNSEAFAKFVNELDARLYPRDKVLDELPSVLSGGQHHSFGLTDDEALGLGQEYAQALMKEHGPDAVRAVFSHGGQVARDIVKSPVPSVTQTPAPVGVEKPLLSPDAIARLNTRFKNPSDPSSDAYVRFALQHLMDGHGMDNLWPSLVSTLEAGPAAWREAGFTDAQAKRIREAYRQEIDRPAPATMPSSAPTEAAQGRTGSPGKTAPRKPRPLQKSDFSRPVLTAKSPDLHVPPPTGTPKPKVSALDQIAEVRKAGLISSPRTLEKILASHALYLGSEEAAKIPAAVVDALRASVEKNDRAVLLPHPADIAKAALHGAVQGVKDAWQILRHGPQALTGPLHQHPLPEFHSDSPLVNAWVGMPVRAVTRTHSAAYHTVKLYAFTRSLQETAALQARHEISRGIYPKSAFAARKDFWFRHPNTRQNLAAISAADEAVFSQSNWLADEVEHARSTAPPVVRFAIDQTVPFVKVPSNILIRGLEYAGGVPYATAEAVYNRFLKKQWGPEEQKRFATTFGRGVAGAAYIYGGYWLASHGVSFGGHTIKAEGFDPDHFDPGGLSIDDKYHPRTGFLAPVGSLVALGAFLYEQQARRDRGEDVPVAGEVGQGLKGMVDGQPLGEANDLFEKLTSPDGAGDELGSQTASFSPTIVSDAAAQFDKTKRDKRGFLPEIKARIPGLRQTLPIKRDVFGDALPESNKLFDPFDVVASGRSQTPAMELARTYSAANASGRKSGGGDPTRTPLDASVLKEKRAIVDKKRAGQDVTADIGRLASETHLTPRERRDLHRKLQENPEVALFDRLSPAEAMNVFDQANADEKRLLHHTLFLKLNADAKKNPDHAAADRAMLVRLLASK